MASLTRALYVIGGQQKRGDHFRDEWHRYRSGVITRVDIESRTAELVHRYESPPEVTPDKQPPCLFKSATRRGNRIYGCTQTEVIVWSLPDFKQEAYLSLPCFNDVHHVRPLSDDRIVVVNTGLDMVIELSLDGTVHREWAVLDEPAWTRFDRAVDYRKVASTKPHLAHPNFCFELDGKLWATRFKQKDAICLDDHSTRFEIGSESPHDGHVVDGLVYFTTVDGTMLAFDATTKELVHKLDLNEITNTNKALGWCRGLYVLNRDEVFIGFTRLRPSRIRENLHWISHRFGKSQFAGTTPTRIALYNIPQRRLVWELSLEDAGQNAVFSVLNADD